MAGDFLAKLKQQFEEGVKATPIEYRKARNSCVSGHSSPDEISACPWCRKARLNTILTGYHSDEPMMGQLIAYLKRGKPKDSNVTALSDYLFVLEYLGLDKEGDNHA